MLFDLQSRGRRTAVKVIYLFLAILMAGGLILLGVGAGNGNGGFLNSLTGGGSGGNSTQNSLVNKALRAAEAKVKANPKSPAAWQAMMQARYDVAGSGTNYNSTTGQFDTKGKAELTKMLAAWTKYSSLVKGTPDESSALEAARAYEITGNYAGASVAWQSFIAATPSESKGYECLAFNAYAAKKTTLANQAAAKVEALTPKLDRLQVKTLFSSAKTSPTSAQQDVAGYCGG